jgi:large conductance mechanosensitive channel
MLKEFKAFILRGNVIELAVAVVIAVAFGAVIKAFVDGIISPLIALPGNTPTFANRAFTIRESVFRYGLVIDTIINFLMVAAAVFFVIVRPVNRMMEKQKTEPDVDTPTKDCPYCLSSIPEGANRCAFCTAQVGAGTTGA